MPECTNCGRFVSKNFVRVFGNNDDEVSACVDCETGRTLRSGGAAISRDRPSV